MAIKKSQRQTRSRRSGASVPVSVGLLAASILGAAFIISANRAPAPAAANKPEIELVGQYDMVEVLVPSNPIPAGVRLSTVRFRKMRFPKHQVPADTLRRMDGYEEAVTLAPLPANLPVFKKNLSLTASASNPIIERIPDGMRAITIRVDATSAVEGWAGTGAIVDVLLITKDRASVVAEQVKILSAERSIDPVTSVSSPEVPSTVTLLVSQEQALAIHAAVQTGKLSFALRSNGDEATWAASDYPTTRLKGKPAAGNEGSQVAGYVHVEGEEKKTFALVGDTWVPSDVKPRGFLVTEEDK